MIYSNILLLFSKFITKYNIFWKIIHNNSSLFQMNSTMSTKCKLSKCFLNKLEKISYSNNNLLHTKYKEKIEDQWSHSQYLSRFMHYHFMDSWIYLFWCWIKPNDWFSSMLIKLRIIIKEMSILPILYSWIKQIKYFFFLIRKGKLIYPQIKTNDILVYCLQSILNFRFLAYHSKLNLEYSRKIEEEPVIWRTLRK